MARRPACRRAGVAIDPAGPYIVDPKTKWDAYQALSTRDVGEVIAPGSY